jgi:HTH-type transcriptional regulator / antitoxin HigA
MLNIRTIKSEPDYEAALARAEVLWDAEAGTPEADELDVLAMLIEKYEDAAYPLELPSPIDAIKFRMEQQGLSKKDLVPFIGSSGRVSEVLSGKRELTLPMIRALNEGLGIPAEVLIRKADGIIPTNDAGVDWSRFPIKEMARLGIVKSKRNLKEHCEDVVRDLIARAGGMNCAAMSHFRKGDSARQSANTDAYALRAWCLHVLASGREQELPVKFRPKAIDKAFLSHVAKLSAASDGPVRARQHLAEHGIALVIAQHPKRTYIDGAAMLTPEGTPVIGMSLRHDRLDNFWFCLLHELAHVGWHLKIGDLEAIIDDLDSPVRGDSAREAEANELAGEALIPLAEWRNHPFHRTLTTLDACNLAAKLCVSPAIVAGRARKETGNFRILSPLVGHREARKQFDTKK